MIRVSRAILFFALVLAFAPLAILLAKAWWFVTPDDQRAWDFIRRFTLPGLFSNTFLLILLTVLMSTLTGFVQAVLVVLTNIKYKSLFNAIFVLPLVFPLYVLSYIYVGALEYSGPLPSYLRELWNWDMTRLIDIKHPLAIAAVFSMGLSPYVYLFQKSFLERIDGKVIWSARALGKGPWKVLFSVILPQSSTWIFAAAILVSLEVLCDFGAVSIFNFETFATAIYEAWAGLFSFNSAMRISTFPVILALCLYGLNSYFRSSLIERENKIMEPIFSPGKTVQVVLFFLVLGYACFSLAFPLGQLLVWSAQVWRETMGSDFFAYLADSAGLACICGILVGGISLVFVFFDRFYWSRWHKALGSLLKLGYALPGSLIGVGVMAIFSLLGMHFFGKVAIFALLAGLVVRFYALGFEMNHKACELIHRKLDWTAQSLGLAPWKAFFRVHFPILRPAFLSSVLLCFLEAIKEMPITLILRPYGVNTLATKIYELTSEGEWERTSPYALLLVGLGVASVYLNQYLRGKKWA